MELSILHLLMAIMRPLAFILKNGIYWITLVLLWRPMCPTDSQTGMVGSFIFPLLYTAAEKHLMCSCILLVLWIDSGSSTGNSNDNSMQRSSAFLFCICCLASSSNCCHPIRLGHEIGKAIHLYSMTAGIKLAPLDAGRELSTQKEWVKPMWCRTHHHNYGQHSEAKEGTGLSTNSSLLPDKDFLRWHLRFNLHSFLRRGGESLPQTLLKQGHVLSSFQPAFPITSSFCLLWVLHTGHIFSTGITTAPFIIKTTSSGTAEFPADSPDLAQGFLLSPGDILFLFTFPSPSSTAYTTSS